MGESESTRQSSPGSNRQSEHFSHCSAARSLARSSSPPPILGMTGWTAYVGLREIAGIEYGDRVFVSAAAGAVGSAAGQFARLMGASLVIGSAGSATRSRAGRGLRVRRCVQLPRRLTSGSPARSLLPTASTSTSTTSAAIISKQRGTRYAKTAASPRVAPSRNTTVNRVPLSPRH